MNALFEVVDLVKTNPRILSIRRMIQSAMSAAAGAFSVAVFAAACSHFARVGAAGALRF